MTLVETAVGSVVMIGLFGLVAVAVQRSNGTFETSMTNASTDSQAQRAIEKVAQQFMDADRSSLTLTPTAPFAANSIDFRRCEGFRNGAMVVGNSRRIWFEHDPGELDDGRDNDSDGLIDEGRVVMFTQDPGTAGNVVTLVDDVAELYEGERADARDNNGNGLIDESGFCATYDPVTFNLTLRLTVATIDPHGATVLRSAETAIRIRND